MSVKACRFLIDVSLRCDEPGHTTCMPLSQLQRFLLAQGSHKTTFPQAFPKPAPEVEEGALLFPTSPLSTLTCGWELNQGYPLLGQVGYWNCWRIGPVRLSSRYPTKALPLSFDLLGAIMGKCSTWNLLYALQRSKLAVPHGPKQISSEETMFSRRKFVCWFFEWDYA